jgi:hypothetical protein
MLWPKFYAIFANFCEKIVFFLKSQCYCQIYATTSSSLSKNEIFAIFCAKIFLNHNIGLWLIDGEECFE